MTGQDLVREVEELNALVHELKEQLNTQDKGALQKQLTDEKIRLLETIKQFLKELINELTLPPKSEQ